MFRFRSLPMRLVKAGTVPARLLSSARVPFSSAPFSPAARSRLSSHRFSQPQSQPTQSLLASATHARAVSFASTLRKISANPNTRKLALWKKVVIGATGTVLLYLGGSTVAEACGIVAFVGDEPAVDYLLEGLHILQSRGYDSAGVSTIDPSGNLVTTKFASKGTTDDCIQQLKSQAPAKHKGHTVGISHTRWATHGAKTDANAHPHSDYKSRVALVHNGTIENSSEIKRELEAKGIPFKSQTDTEVIVQLVGHYLDEGLDFPAALKKSLSRLEGTWGIAAIHKDYPHQVIAARNGSPLVIGIANDGKRMFVASEVSAFSRHTNQYIALSDGEVAVVQQGAGSLDLSRVAQAHQETIEMSPAPFPHWTIKEIYEQPAAMLRTLNYGARFAAGDQVKLGGLEANSPMLLNIHHLTMAACGTSYFASLYGASLMRSLKCFDTVQCFDAGEVIPDSFPPANGGLLVLSQSGETKDTHRSLVVAESLNVPRFSIINQVGSLLARSTNCGVYLNAGREHAVASTKAFTTQVTALAMVAGWFAQNRPLTASVTQRRSEIINSLHRLPIYCGITLRTHDQCKSLAHKLKDAKHMFILGKGYAEPIAREGALKIKEITYVHAEGFSGGALKHGPFALLEKGTPVVLLILDDQHAELMRIAAAEVRARGAYTLVITDKPQLANEIADDTIIIPSNGPMTALLAVVPLQLLAYEMSVQKGFNPDKPRNLAKAVTVD